MSDFRDILGLGKHEPGMAPARKPKLSIQKPEGMSREVFALLNQDGKGIPGSAPPLVPAPSPKDTFKEKIGRVIGWDWKHFSHSARSDSLELSHWQKNNDRSTSYSFARFNKVVKVLSYTEAEYGQWLQHPTWTKAETDTLFELCRRFDLRWPVIHDRMPGSRTVEALKDRFYAVCRMLLQGRLGASDGGSTSANELAEHPLARFSFEERHEMERKAEFERLYARSADEVAEEGRRLEQAKLLETKLRAQKKQLKPGGKAATIHALKATLAASGLGSGSDLALAGLPSLAGLMEPPKRPRSVGAWLRSADVSTKRPASEKQLSHFEQRLKDLGMPAHVLPTESNVRLYNTCRAHVVLLIELESKLKRLEYERNVLQVKKAGGSAAGGAPSPGVGHAAKRARGEQGERAVKRSHH